MEKISISHLHHHLSLPHTVFCCVITPQNLHHRDIFGAELTNLSVYYRHWILFIDQILTKLNCLRRKYMRRVRDLLLNIDTWKTGWIRIIFGGNTNLYATSPTLDRISNSPMYLEARFRFYQNITTPFIGDTFRNTKSPTENDTSFLLGFA